MKFWIKEEKKPFREDLIESAFQAAVFLVVMYIGMPIFPMPAPWPLCALAFALASVCSGSTILLIKRLKQPSPSLLVELPEWLVKELSQPAKFRERLRRLHRLRNEHNVPMGLGIYLQDSILGKKLPGHVLVWAQGPLHDPDN